MTARELEQEIVSTESIYQKKENVLNAKQNRSEKKITGFTIAAWVCIATGGLIAIITFVIGAKIDAENVYFGLTVSLTMVGALWSLAGLFFIYVAFLGQKGQMILQQIELMNSRLEVKYTRLELTRQKDAMSAQNITLELQKFDNTFFKLMDNHVKMVADMKINVSVSHSEMGRPIEYIGEGKTCFVEIHRCLRKLIMNSKGDHSELSSVLPMYDNLYKHFGADLSYYFRNLYNIFKFINSSGIEDKKRYSNFLRAQLSPSEAVLLMYNCSSQYGIEYFKPMVIKFNLVKHFEGKTGIEKKHINQFRKENKLPPFNTIDPLFLLMK